MDAYAFFIFAFIGFVGINLLLFRKRIFFQQFLNKQKWGYVLFMSPIFLVVGLLLFLVENSTAKLLVKSFEGSVWDGTSAALSGLVWGTMEGYLLFFYLLYLVRGIISILRNTTDY